MTIDDRISQPRSAIDRRSHEPNRPGRPSPATDLGVDRA